MPTNKGSIVFREAIADDIESMTTMVPRAFAPDAFLPQIIPDTSLVREWWAETYNAALNDPAAHLLVAIDGDNTVGILTLHYLGPDSPSSASSAITAAVPTTTDHSPKLAEALEDMKEERRELMGNDPHFLIELLGVDEEYKGFGIGRDLVERACRIADDRDAAVYLQTTAAKDYYTKKMNLGFEERKEYKEHSSGGTVVRPQKSKADATRLSTRNEE